jgi:amino acid transporter
MRKPTPRSEKNLNDLYESSDSPVMPTRYAHKSSKLIRSIEKTFYPIIGLVAALFIFAVLDMTDVVSRYNLLPDRVYDMIIAFASAILLIVVVYLLYGLIKSRRKLHHWADVFERNSIRAGIAITMSTTSRRDVLRALYETIEGIGGPLKNYLFSSPEQYKNLIDVKVDEGPVFDILIDKDHLTSQLLNNQVSSIAVSSETTTESVPDKKEEYSKVTSDLIESTKEYGAIIVKIINGRVSKEIVRSFQESISKYTSLTKNKVGLALIIGKSIEAEADPLSKARIKGMDYLVLIEKND